MIDGRLSIDHSRIPLAPTGVAQSDAESRTGDADPSADPDSGGRYADGRAPGTKSGVAGGLVARWTHPIESLWSGSKHAMGPACRCGALNPPHRHCRICTVPFLEGPAGEYVNRVHPLFFRRQNLGWACADHADELRAREPTPRSWPFVILGSEEQLHRARTFADDPWLAGKFAEYRGEELLHIESLPAGTGNELSEDAGPSADDRPANLEDITFPRREGAPSSRRPPRQARIFYPGIVQGP